MPNSVHIYCDGSYVQRSGGKNSPSGWAFCTKGILHETTCEFLEVGKFKLFGKAQGTPTKKLIEFLCLDQDHYFAMSGSEVLYSKNSGAAELMPMLKALRWLRGQKLDITIHSDSEYAGFAFLPEKRYILNDQNLWMREEVVELSEGHIIKFNWVRSKPPPIEISFCHGQARREMKQLMNEMGLTTGRHGRAIKKVIL